MENVTVMTDKEIALPTPVKRNVAIHFFAGLKLELGTNDDVYSGGKKVGRYNGLKGIQTKKGTKYEVLVQFNENFNMQDFIKAANSGGYTSMEGALSEH